MYKILKLQFSTVYLLTFAKQVAQWPTITHLGASIMFGDILIYDAQRQVTLNLKQ